MFFFIISGIHKSNTRARDSARTAIHRVISSHIGSIGIYKPCTARFRSADVNAERGHGNESITQSAMDRSRRTRNEPPSRQEDAADSEPTHPRRGNSSTSAATGTRPPTFSDNGNNYYISEPSRPHPSSHSLTQPTSRISMPRGRMYASTVEDPPVMGPSYTRPHRKDHNENSTANSQRLGRASAYAPPSVCAPISFYSVAPRTI